MDKPRAGLYYWALPDKLMGNRVSAYGGNLTFYQRWGDPVPKLTLADQTGLLR